MNGNAEFIVYCLEEYKAVKGMAGKEVITLFRKYNIIDYIVFCYGALHTMGGLAITEDIDSFIDDMKKAVCPVIKSPSQFCRNEDRYSPCTDMILL